MQLLLFKTCTKCGQTKPFTEFGEDKSKRNGRRPDCKRCRQKYPAQREHNLECRARGLRHCASCHRWLEVSQFYPNSFYKDGLHYQCKECSIKNARNWQRRHPDKYRNRYLEYSATHRDLRRAKTHQYYIEHQEQLQKRSIEYRRTSAGKAVQARANHLRRTLNKQNPATLTEAEWQQILESQEHRCARCGRTFSDSLKPTRDHIIPLSKGGPLSKDNTQALCKSCNSSKYDKLIRY